MVIYRYWGERKFVLRPFDLAQGRTAYFVLRKAFDVGFDSQDVGVAIAVCVSVRAGAEGEVGETAPIL